MGKISTNQFDQKQKFRELAIAMLEKIKDEYNKSGKDWENLGDEKDKKSEKYRLEKLSNMELSNATDENLVEYLESLENAFLYTISKLPWKDRDGNCHYPVGENKVTDKFLDKVADAINDGNADQLNGENFATVLLPNESIENSNIKYAIPQCIKGDITNAKLYHCLLNPGSGISDTKDNYDNFYDYLHDKDAMKDHLRIFDENGYATKEKLVEYMNDLKRNMLITEFEDFIAKYGNCTISENKVDEIFGDNGEKEFYYIMKYYKTLVAKGIGDFRKILKKNLSNLGTLSSNLNDVKLCNLELIPVRSQDGATVGNLIDENPFAVNVILRRIYIAELKNELEKPIFVFRSYYSTQNKNDVRWQDAFKRKTDNYDGLYEYLINNYFLTHSGTQGGAYSKNNIVTISQEGRKGPKFKVEDYKDSGKTKGLENKIELASRAYKYIDDAQNTFASGLKRKNN